MGNVIKELENYYLKITVEETLENEFIATRWKKDLTEENEKEVVNFATVGGALDQALYWLWRYVEDKDL